MAPKLTAPRWVLNDLFKGPDDPQISTLLQAQYDAAVAFAEQYRGKLHHFVSQPDLLATAIAAYELIVRESTKPEEYAMLLFAADTHPPQHGALVHYVRTQGIRVRNELLFFELELLELTQQDFKKLLQAPELQIYHYFLEQQLQAKQHRLSEKEEKLLNDKSTTGAGALVRLFEQELARKEFVLPGSKKPKKLSEGAVLHLLYDAKRSVRQQAAQSLTQGLQEEAPRLTFIYNTLLHDKQIDDRYTHFDEPEDARHLSNQIERTDVDAMVSAVQEGYSLVTRYYTLKKKLLGLKKLVDYDRYAPVSTHKTSFSFTAAKKTVLEAFTSFSPQYATLASDFFDHQWIDAATRPGKQPGAFCMYISPDLHPYVLMNYHGAIEDVRTLAHELGHGVHASLARKQTFLNFSGPLTMAETASVFSEMLLFDHLKNKLTSKQEKISLYTGTIEAMFATVFRQTSMFLFERQVHAARRKGELTTEAINAMWMNTQQAMFGKSVTLTSDYAWWWSYIPHFIRSPFYVYSYAFGELLSLSLYKLYKENRATFVPNYLNMLAAGGSQSPHDLVKPFGIKLSDKAFWQAGIMEIDSLITELEALV